MLAKLTYYIIYTNLPIKIYNINYVVKKSIPIYILTIIWY